MAQHLFLVHDRVLIDIAHVLRPRSAIGLGLPPDLIKVVGRVARLQLHLGQITIETTLVDIYYLFDEVLLRCNLVRNLNRAPDVQRRLILVFLAKLGGLELGFVDQLGDILLAADLSPF